MEEEKNKMKDQDDGEDLKAICFFVKKRHTKCYCIDMDSLKIYQAIRYCMESFEQCEIYEKLLKEGPNHK
jgi:hypothetical protein